MVCKEVGAGCANLIKKVSRERERERERRKGNRKKEEGVD